MPINDLEYLFRPEKINSVELRGYVWKVIEDPTRGVEEPGLFYGRLFRMIDLRLGRDEKSTWPDGIIFEHTSSKCLLTFQKGVLVDLTNSKILQKKPRIRNRNTQRVPSTSIERIQHTGDRQ